MFSYNKCHLNTNLAAVPRFKIVYFCLFLQLAIKFVADWKSWLCRRKIQQIFEDNIVYICVFFKYAHLNCCVMEECIFLKAGKKHNEIKFYTDCDSTF